MVNIYVNVIQTISEITKSIILELKEIGVKKSFKV